MGDIKTLSMKVIQQLITLTEIKTENSHDYAQERLNNSGRDMYIFKGKCNWRMISYQLFLLIFLTEVIWMCIFLICNINDREKHILL